MPDDLCADRSAQDVVTATLVARTDLAPTDARVVAAHVVSDLIGADWFVVARRNLTTIANHCGETT